MTVKQLIKHRLEFLRLKGGWTGASESIHVKKSHCWIAHVAAQMLLKISKQYILCDIKVSINLEYFNYINRKKYRK